MYCVCLWTSGGGGKESLVSSESLCSLEAEHTGHHSSWVGEWVGGQAAAGHDSLLHCQRWKVGKKIFIPVFKWKRATMGKNSNGWRRSSGTTISVLRQAARARNLHDFRPSTRKKARKELGKHVNPHQCVADVLCCR